MTQLLAKRNYCKLSCVVYLLVLVFVLFDVLVLLLVVLLLCKRLQGLDAAVGGRLGQADGGRFVMREGHAVGLVQHL
jgi:hypothetical protein